MPLHYAPVLETGCDAEWYAVNTEGSENARKAIGNKKTPAKARGLMNFHLL